MVGGILTAMGAKLMLINVMIVDDSLVVRGLLRRIIEKHCDLNVLTTCADGASAVQQYKTFSPDVVLMDVEMPIMNGIEAVRQICEHDPDARILMCSSLTHAMADATVRALDAGALDFVSKPTAQTVDGSSEFEDALIGKIRLLGQKSAEGEDAVKATLNTRDYTPISPSVIAIGSSTGGPKALTDMFAYIKAAPACPILITQHIPAGFSEQLAARIERVCGIRAVQATNGMALEKGVIYIAPGGQHMTVNAKSAPHIVLTDGPLVNFCRPSVDVMLQSIGQVYGKNILTLILTGMGEDGKQGCKFLRDLSPTNVVLVQNEASSVVWGMPKAVAAAGAAHAVHDLHQLAEHMNHMIAMKRGSS